jgi:hypothetical protein
MNAQEPFAEPDALERRLAGTSPRPAPAELRAAVLRAAVKVGQADSLPAAASGSAALSAPSAPPAWWEHLLARFPLATGGFAACWLIAWLGGSADRWLNGPVAAAPVRVSAEQVAEARAQRAELRQLAGWEEPVPAVSKAPAAWPRRETPVNRPRGDRRRLRDDAFGHLAGPDSFLAV